MYVATLTADEIVYAGGKVEGSGDFYLLNDFQIASWLDGLYWYSLSPSAAESGFETVFRVNHYGVLLYQGFVYDSESNFRPSVVLRSDVSLGLTNYTQDGTIDKPYVIG